MQCSKKKKYPTNFNVYRLRNDLMQFNNNQECEFNTNLLCMLLLLSPPTPFYCKNCRKLSLHEHLVTNISPPVVRAACSRLQKNLADILKFIFNLKCEIWGNCQYFVFRNLLSTCVLSIFHIDFVISSNKNSFNYVNEQQM